MKDTTGLVYRIRIDTALHRLVRRSFMAASRRIFMTFLRQLDIYALGLKASNAAVLFARSSGHRVYSSLPNRSEEQGKKL